MDKDRLTRLEGIEHYGIITDIAAIFEVTNTDICLSVRISCTVLYSNSVLSCYSLTYKRITWKETKKIYKGKRSSLMKKSFACDAKSIWISIPRPISPLTGILAQKTHMNVRKRIPTEKGRQFQIQKLKKNFS